ncbi:hydrogen peroxide-inducible genes activator [Marinicella sp. S1101]|uniref:hydrogen peroxide-inducible genes activator n=1 Tax=Marinicella marina TaxID=2996016 RepID=UPI002260D06D|nr:hydrogen peroxide-inducible genes activator [Marinicella marina]MCX7552679.1 hydrogen peroxide-inducible genes activator [Marinicella marina]MDJ1139555.1 hydrogen peroxide-inducible genes activator [Marinicella marina]
MHFPTIKQLKYFNALIEHNHFGKAAESCFVSQSAFSVAIKELENALGGRLVDRTNKSVTVTNLGREIYQQSLAVMGEMKKMLDLAQGNMMPLSGQLSLGMIPTIGPFVLPELLPELKRQYPDLDLEIHEGKSADIYDQLMRGQLDVILLALPYEMRSVETLTLFKDRFRLISSVNNQWLKGRKFDIDDLDDGSVLLLDDGHCLRDHAISACHIKHVDKVSQFTASSLLTLVEMVKQDLGVSFIPEMALNLPIFNSEEVKVDALEFDAYREIGLAWRKGSTRAKEFQMLGDCVVQAIEEKITLY